MMLVVGLGNPGQEYVYTRHNAGWLALDYFKHHHRGLNWSRQNNCSQVNLKLGQISVLLAKPELFMNRSGIPVAALMIRYGIQSSDLVVLHDDLDIPLGSIKLKRNGGAGGHKGIESLVHSTGNADFFRVRIGIGRPTQMTDPVDYVLTEPSDDSEKSQFMHGVSLAANALDMIIIEGFHKAMNIFNSRPIRDDVSDVNLDNGTKTNVVRSQINDEC